MIMQRRFKLEVALWVCLSEQGSTGLSVWREEDCSVIEVYSTLRAQSLPEPTLNVAQSIVVSENTDSVPSPEESVMSFAKPLVLTVLTSATFSTLYNSRPHFDNIRGGVAISLLTISCSLMLKRIKGGFKCTIHPRTTLVWAALVGEFADVVVGTLRLANTLDSRNQQRNRD
ncbi:hypothetical protein J6590_034397 [Homalodisca vitripennis]|nr:hypothetical protein J6590_034397 [Homalodisca vitripennis]